MAPADSGAQAEIALEKNAEQSDAAPGLAGTIGRIFGQLRGSAIQMGAIRLLPIRLRCDLGDDRRRPGGIAARNLP